MWKIDSELIPVTSTPLTINVNQRQHIYAYVCSDNDVMYQKVQNVNPEKTCKRILPYKFIFTTIKKFKPDELMGDLRKVFYRYSLTGS